MKKYLIGGLFFIAIVAVGLGLNMKKLYPKLFFCLKQDKLVAVTKTDKKIRLMSACQGKTIEEFDTSNGNQYVFGRKGILELKSEKKKISVPVENLEAERSVYQGLRYYEYDKKEWKELDIPKLVNEEEAFETVNFVPSIDDGKFLGSVNLYDTKSVEFYRGFFGPAPKSSYLITLDPNSGEYKKYENGEKARRATINATTIESKSFYENNGCSHHALGSNKVYVFPCLKEMGQLGPILAYDPGSDKVDLVTKENDILGINDLFEPVFPDDTDFYFYLTRYSGRTAYTEAQAYSAGKKTEFYAHKKGTNETVASLELNGVNLGTGMPGQKIINLINRKNNPEVYFTVGRKVGSDEKEVKYELDLYKANTQNKDNLTKVATVDGVNSCGNDSVVYIPNGGGSLVYTYMNNEIKFELPDLENGTIAWCY